MFGPVGTPLPPLGCLIVGAAMLGLGAVVLTIVAIQPKWWTRRRGLHARWSFGNYSGAPVSRIGGTAWGLFISVFGAVSILNGYLGVLPKSRVLLILFAVFGMVIIAATIDGRKHKRRRRRKRT